MGYPKILFDMMGYPKLTILMSWDIPRYYFDMMGYPIVTILISWDIPYILFIYVEISPNHHIQCNSMFIIYHK